MNRRSSPSGAYPGPLDAKTIMAVTQNVGSCATTKCQRDNAPRVPTITSRMLFGARRDGAARLGGCQPMRALEIDEGAIWDSYWSLVNASRVDDAIALLTRTAAMYEDFASAGSLEAKRRLIHWLGVLGVSLGSSGRHSEALSHHRRAVWLSRSLDQSNPNDEAALARSLLSLGVCRLRCGHTRRGLPALREAVSIQRRLVDVDEAHRHVLAEALVSLSEALVYLGEWAEATDAARGAVELTLEMADNDHAHLRRLPGAIELLRIASKHLGWPARPLDVTQQSIESYRDRGVVLVDEHDAGLMHLLLSYATMLDDSHQYREALGIISEVTDYYRRCARTSGDPVDNNHLYLARCLFIAAGAHVSLGEHDEALAPASESAELYESFLVAAEDHWGPKHPKTDNYSAQLSGSLRRKAEILRHLGDYEAARGPASQALDLLEHRARKLPDGDRSGYAIALLTVAEIEFHSGDCAQALRRCRRAIRLLEDSAHVTPTDAGDLANALSQLAHFEYLRGNRLRGLALSEDAVITYADFVRRYPECFRPGRALALHEQHELYSVGVLHAPTDDSTSRGAQVAEGLAEFFNRLSG